MTDATDEQSDWTGKSIKKNEFKNKALLDACVFEGLEKQLVILVQKQGVSLSLGRFDTLEPRQ